METAKRVKSSKTIKSPPKCRIVELPLELIAEILSWTNSPRDVLALARTSKHFCAVLVNNPATQFIWRRARSRFLPAPIPDFTPNLTEASYAALLFDSKFCEMCDSKIKGTYYSFALRAAICSAVSSLFPSLPARPETLLDAMQVFIQNKLYAVTSEDRQKYPEFLSWMVALETPSHHFIDEEFRRVEVRRSDWDAAVNEHRKVHLLGPAAVEAYVQTKQVLADALPTKKEFFTRVLRWKTRYDTVRDSVVRDNYSMVTSLATKIRQPIRDVLHSHSFNSLYGAKNRCLELITQEECTAIEDVVYSEIAAVRAREENRIQEHARYQRFKQIRSTRDTMKPDEDIAHILPIPNLDEFRRLPVIKIYEAAGPSPAGTDSSSSSSFPRSLKDPFVASVLNENLNQWRENARAALAGVLGFPGWRTHSQRKLHPVDRLSTRFRCKRCDACPATGRAPRIPLPEDGGMDFAEACEHTCAHMQKKKKARDRWSADRFAIDQKAADAISQVLALCGTTADSVLSIPITKELGDRVQCQSCHLVMDVASVGRHCKRHVDGSFILLPNGARAEPELEHGLAHMLMKDSKAAAERDAKIFVCRHCAVPHLSGTSPTRLLSFNGMRSHLKEKHLIASPADEDFFRQKDAVADDAAMEVAA